MAFKKGQGGRKKGSKNKFQFNPELTAKAMGVDPMEYCLSIVKGDWAQAGFPDEFIFSENAEGSVKARPCITPEMRVKCIEIAMKYLYSTKQSTEVKVPEGIEIVVKDYVTK